MTSKSQLHVIDMEPLFDANATSARRHVADAIEAACRSTGFFYITGHRIPAKTLEQLDSASRQFFALPTEDKMEIAMAKGGIAWRGWFPVGGELTSGKADLKEGLYLGFELPRDDQRVVNGLPFHGSNLWPRLVPELRGAVLGYMTATIAAASALMEGVALSLGLDDGYFEQRYTTDPTVLFRIFRYPATTDAEKATEQWGVGEHTDYGLLTLLLQDERGGLQVRSDESWIDAPPVPGTLICNIGDMLDRMTGGWYRSTPHRVNNTSGLDRLSFPLFFDPNLAAAVRPLPQHALSDADLIAADRSRRWDAASVHIFEGTYGDYLMRKVAKVFPELGARVLTR
jgi:isopenicillin N synthase-like dioxygenase